MTAPARKPKLQAAPAPTTAPPSGFYDEPVSIKGRVPPHDLDSEAAVLSAAMIDATALDKVLEFLKPEHFYSEAHRRVFEACSALREASQPVDIMTVGTWLKDRERIQQVGGLPYLTDLLNAKTSVANVAAYGRTIREKSRVRQLIATCQTIAAEGYSDYGDADTFVARASEQLGVLGTAAVTPWSSSLMPVAADWYELRPPPMAFLLRDSRRAGADGVLPLGKVGQLIAEGGVGKTMTVMALAVGVATGTPWLGTFVPTATGRAFVACGEEDHGEARRRLYNARMASGAPAPEPGSIVVLPLAGIPCPMLERTADGLFVESAFLTWLRGWLVKNGPWSLIVIDPLSRFAGPDAEIDNAAATRFVQALESIASATAATVIVAHHTNKLARRGGALDAAAGRGSSALVDGVRWQCALAIERVAIDDPDERERLGEIVTWSHTKSNYSRRAESLLLRRDLDHGGALIPLDADDTSRLSTARTTAPTMAREAARAAGVDAKVSADAARLAEIIRAEPGIGSRKLRDKSRLGPVAIGHAIEQLLAGGQVENRAEVHGARQDPHFFIREQTS